MPDSPPKLKSIVPPAQNRCFGCGPENPSGLRLEFVSAPGHTVSCTTALSDTFESFRGYIHGGIIATLLDEAMSKAIRIRGISAMTRQIEIEYLRPVPSGKSICIEGRIVRNEGRNYWLEARVTNGRGTTLAQGIGHFIQIRSR